MFDIISHHFNFNYFICLCCFCLRCDFSLRILLHWPSHLFSSSGNNIRCIVKHHNLSPESYKISFISVIILSSCLFLGSLSQFYSNSQFSLDCFQFRVADFWCYQFKIFLLEFLNALISYPPVSHFSLLFLSVNTSQFYRIFRLWFTLILLPDNCTFIFVFIYFCFHTYKYTSIHVYVQICIYTLYAIYWYNISNYIIYTQQFFLSFGLYYLLSPHFKTTYNIVSSGLLAHRDIPDLVPESGWCFPPSQLGLPLLISAPLGNQHPSGHSLGPWSQLLSASFQGQVQSLLWAPYFMQWSWISCYHALNLNLPYC